MTESNSGKEYDSKYAPVGQEEAPEQKSTSCFSITTIRRTFRISVLILVLIFLVVTPIVVIRFLYTYKKYDVSTAKPLKVSITNCKVYISEDSSLAVDTVHLIIDLPGISFIFCCRSGSG